MEIQLWGWNPATVGFIGTIIFTLWQGWGYIRQIKAVNRSVDSISLPFFALSACAFSMAFIFGLATGRIAMTFNGLLVILHLPIITAVRRIRGFARPEQLLVTSLLVAVVIDIILPFKGEFMTIFAFGWVIGGVMQLAEVWRTKSAGDLEPRLITTMLVATVFWAVYSFATHNVPIMVVAPINLALIGLTLYLLFKYPSAKAS